MSNSVLITGASSGIGAAFANQLAREGNDLVLVARDLTRLEKQKIELESNYNTNVEVISADLSTEEGIKSITARIEQKENPVDFLINNAGFGSKGSFIEIPQEKHDEMLFVNVRAVLDLTHAAARVFSERGSGDILNIASVAGWTPSLRPSSTYAATKAFVTALSEGLAPTLKNSGVRISVLCPGFVRTEFHERAGIKMSKMPNLLWLTPEYVVAKALKDHRAGKVISIPSMRYKAVVLGVRFMPRWLSSRIAQRLGKRSHKKSH